jgi:class 3 adenylate cyclase/tetratricopeptide (TPR) repeat protein
MSNEGRRERKVVSVLFADLVGFTSRAESLDPEDVEAILRPYHERLRAELERRGGTVEKFIGDAVMAVFGAPIAHEDDPERAVRAALAIRDWIRDEGELEVRIGVNTGEVLVSLDPSAGAERGLVAGDAVNTAARLQTAARVNGILVGDATYRATTGVIEYGQAPAIAAKGKAEPVPVWEAIEARSRYGEDIAQGPATPLVGRERELGLLADTLARAEHERAPQLVTLVGVPGIGKSRLVRELFALIDSRPELIYWRQGRCLPYGEGVAFWALGEIVKAHAGILEGEPEERMATKLHAVVEEAVPDAGEAEWVERLLRPLLGLGDTGEASEDRRVESFAAWRRFFEGLAELDPLVLVFEDLHWADEGLLDFVDHLVDWAGSVPILVVATARPELLSRRQGWGGGKPNAATISLSPLSEDETAKLLHGLLERAVLPADIQARLLERAGGNPLYAEEFARIAREGGFGDLPLPESVQGLIAARLDGLELEEKTLLQNASVIGKVFWLGTAAALAGNEDRRVAEELLHALERKQFVRRDRRSSVEGELQYAFMHGLVREVAYAQIPRADRAEKHERAAVWIESLGRPEDHAEMLAHHYLNALDTARAAGQAAQSLENAARVALRMAGDRAASLNAFTDAVRDYDQALELWPEDDPARPRLLLAAAMARFQAEVWDEGELAIARDALLAGDDRAGAAEAEILRAEVFWLLGRGDDVFRSQERAAELAEGLPLSDAKARVYAGVFRLHWLGSREKLAETFQQQALAMADELGLKGVRAQILSASGARRTMRGDRGGFEAMEESIALFEELNSADAQRPYNNLADGYYNLGELSRAAETTRRMKEAWKRFAAIDWLRWNDHQESALLYMAGRWDEALEMCDRWIADARARDGHYLEARWRGLRGRILLARGAEAEALEEAELGVERARVAGDPQLLIPLFAFRLRALWAVGAGVIAPLVDELVDACRTAPQSVAHDWFPEVAIPLVGLDRTAELEAMAETVPTPTPWREGGLALGRGDPLAAAAIFGQMGARPLEAEAQLLAAKAGLDSDLPAAIEFFRSVGATAYLSQAEALLAKSRSA